MHKVIIVTGTPGVGKTALARLLARKTHSTILNVGDLVKAEGLYRRYDRSRQSYIIDERRLRARLRQYLESHAGKNVLIEAHWIGKFMPKTRGMTAIVVRLDPTILAKRLKARKWPRRKIWENVESELIDLSLYEALKFLNHRRVHQIDSTRRTLGQMLQDSLHLMSARKGWDGRTPDWLQIYDPIELSRRIL